MKEPLSLMADAGIQDPVAQDNFNKLNQLFQGAFPIRTGRLANLSVVNLTAAAIPWALSWARIGNIITLHFDNPNANIGGTKSGTVAPALAGALPAVIWPRQLVNIPWPITNNAVNTIGAMEISAAGNVRWVDVTWVNAATADLYPSSATYLGN